MPKAESKAGKLIATVKAGRLVRQTRKTGQVSSNMPVVTAERKMKKEEDSHKAMKAFHSCFCKENHPYLLRASFARKYFAHST